MYTEQEIAAEKVFDATTLKAWEAFWPVEAAAKKAYSDMMAPAELALKDALQKAYEECMRASGHEDKL